MDFKYAKVKDFSDKIAIQAEIIRLTILAAIHRAKDQGLKIIINSIYGVLGFFRFILYNRTIAEGVTTQSRDIIHYTIDCINTYFKNKWHLDSETHKAMGLESAPPKYEKDVVNYADTDSVFLVLDGIYKQSGFKGSFNDFATKLDEVFFKDFIASTMDDYADIYGASSRRPNGDSSMNLELEQVCHGILFVSKKKYIKEVSKEGHVEYAKGEAIKVKGLEINQSSTPMWVRKKLMEAVKYLLSHENLTSSDINEWVYTNVRNPFMSTHIENICITERVGNYGKFIVKDTDQFEVGSGCKPHVRGAGYYNYLLHNSDYKNKYAFLGTSDKVMHYSTKNDPKCDSFAFSYGSYPIEFAPECDRDLQFEKVFLGPLNNMITPMGFRKLKPDMVMMESLF